MKITCNSCGSKYTIADAKVQGKKVKVRCKGCKESILVDGTQLSGNEPAEASDPSATEVSDDDTAPADAADVAPAAKKNVWSVNLSDDDSRDMTLSELVAAWKAGIVTSDAYVWKDGMSDWKPILEVGELKLKLGPAPKKGGGVISSAGGVAAPKAAKSDKMDDLFGGVDAPGGDAGDAQKQLLGGGGSGGGKPTGARNDSSVLFSLDSLSQSSEDQAKPAAEADLFGGMNTGGGFGGGFASNNMDLLTAPAKDPPPAPAGARLTAPAALPMSAPPSGKSKMPLIIGAVVAALALGGIAFALGGSGGDESEVDEKLAAAQAEAEKAKKEAEEAKKKAEEELKKKEAELKKAAEEAKKKEEEAKKDDGDKKEEEEKKEEETKEASPSSASSSSSSKKSEKEAASPAPAAAASGPSFDVGAAKAALSAAAANAAGCRKPGGPTGAGRVQLTFSTSGRVSSASIVSGPFGGTAVGGCVVSAFRGARVPAFSGSPQTVSKSFKVQ